MSYIDPWALEQEFVRQGCLDGARWLRVLLKDLFQLFYLLLRESRLGFRFPIGQGGVFGREVATMLGVVQVRQAVEIGGVNMILIICILDIHGLALGIVVCGPVVRLGTELHVHGGGAAGEGGKRVAVQSVERPTTLGTLVSTGPRKSASRSRLSS